MDPLTGRTIRARGMAVSLLRYANREKVAQALTQQGYSVTRMTVNRWARGSEMPPIAAHMISDLFGHQGMTKAAAPDWERLQRTVDAIAEKLGVSLDEERAAVDATIAGLTRPPGGGSEADPLADDLADVELHGGHEPG